jgi:HNH endonuclease/AP2 domain
MPARHPIKILPAQGYLLACFDYDPATGVLTWKHRPREHFATERVWRIWNTRFAGHTAGNRHKSGCYYVYLEHHLYKAHRLISKWMTGEEPPATIDHRHGDPYDNRWETLRGATQTQQNQNRRHLQRNNTSGFRGVRQYPSGRYYARIQNRSLGAFDTAEEASAAYEAAARATFGEFYREK